MLCLMMGKVGKSTLTTLWRSYAREKRIFEMMEVFSLIKNGKSFPLNVPLVYGCDLSEMVTLQRLREQVSLYHAGKISQVFISIRALGYFALPTSILYTGIHFMNSNIKK